MMRMILSLAAFFLLGYAASLLGAAPLLADRIPTSGGDLQITFLGHGSLVLSFQGKVIHVDPYGPLAGYKALPQADLILVTHDHPDHLDPAVIAAVRKPGTLIAANPSSAQKIPGAAAMKNGEKKTFLGIPVEAVPAYNILHKRDGGVPFHPRGEGNGYVLAFADKRVYVAGDTEDIPEMEDLKGVDVAFLPVNLPYTMTPEMLAEAAGMIQPKILYPYHTGDTDMERVSELLKGLKGTEVRIRPMK